MLDRVIEAICFYKLQNYFFVPLFCAIGVFFSELLQIFHVILHFVHGNVYFVVANLLKLKLIVLFFLFFKIWVKFHFIFLNQIFVFLLCPGMPDFIILNCQLPQRIAKHSNILIRAFRVVFPAIFPNKPHINPKLLW